MNATPAVPTRSGGRPNRRSAYRQSICSPCAAGRAVDVGEQGLVDVDDGGSDRRVHQSDGECGQVVVADEQQRGGGEVVLLVEPAGPPERGLRGRGHVIEIAARGGRAVDPRDDRGEVVGAVGDRPGPHVRRDAVGQGGEGERVAVAAGVEDLQHRLDGAPRQPRLPDQAGQIVRALGEQHRHPRSPHRSGPEPGHEQIDEPVHRAIIPVQELPSSPTVTRGQITPAMDHNMGDPGGGSGGRSPSGAGLGAPPPVKCGTRVGERVPRTCMTTGGAEGNRTPDLLDANETRYQLRYSPDVRVNRTSQR